MDARKPNWLPDCAHVVCDRLFTLSKSDLKFKWIKLDWFWRAKRRFCAISRIPWTFCHRLATETANGPYGRVLDSMEILAKPSLSLFPGGNPTMLLP